MQEGHSISESLRRFGWMPLLVVFVAVALNILCAVLLKTVADLGDVSPWVLIASIGVVAALNGLRFLVWGVAHRKYPLSLSYPLSSMFFPMMLGVSYLYGDPVQATQVLGTGLITVGVLWGALRVNAE